MYVFNTLLKYWIVIKPLVIAVGIFTLACTIINIFLTLVIYSMKKLQQKYPLFFLTMLSKRFKAWKLLISIALGLYITTIATAIPAPIEHSVNHIIYILVIATFSWFILDCISVLHLTVLNYYQLKSADNFKARKIYTQLKVITRILYGFIIIVAVSTILMTFEKIRNVGLSILASAGVFTAIVVFAAQKSIGTLLAGFQVAIAQPIRIDDVVIVENEWGVIEEITLNYVVIRIWDKRRLIIPITYFLEKPFQNWSRQSTDLLGTIFIYTDYYIPLDKLREELKSILDQSPLWDKQAFNIQVTDVKPSVMELRILVSAHNASNLWDLRCLVREKLLNYIAKNYPQSLPCTRIMLEEYNFINNRHS